MNVLNRNFMKRVSLLLITFLSVVTIDAQIVNIPDTYFINTLIADGVDTNGDGEIQVAEATSITIIVHNNTLLKTFDCLLNQLTKIDISNNLDLDLSQHTVLEDVRCYNNQLTSLNKKERI
jgi:hypothetical protein